ncbi:MAG: VOC family protein [Pseudomonadota bacterium]
MADQRPAPHAGLRHIALFVPDLTACEHFYCTLLGMREEWRPDDDNLYLCSGNDNLALHRRSKDTEATDQDSRLDHIGFVLDDMAQVDEWHAFLEQAGVPIAQAPKTHRDGARSFYCHDPAGTLVQMIYHPPIAGWRG